VFAAITIAALTAVLLFSGKKAAAAAPSSIASALLQGEGLLDGKDGEYAVWFDRGNDIYYWTWQEKHTDQGFRSPDFETRQEVESDLAKHVTPKG
jgi:hypothetical protein